MNYLTAIFLGLVEGLTEFLPISSTFHLIWTGKMLALAENEFLTIFEVVIQAGAIFAVIVLYHQTIWLEKRYFRLLSLSFFPTMLVGLLLYKTIKGVFFANDLLQISVFISFGIVFIIFEKYSHDKKLTRLGNSLKNKEALLVGLAQGLAVIPGISRAGVVILALMLLGIKRAEAAKYSFLLAAPTILAAASFDFWQNKDLLLFNSNYLWQLVIGMIVSFLSALVVMKLFITFLQKHSLVFFGYYRIIVGLLIVVYLLLTSK